MKNSILMSCLLVSSIGVAFGAVAFKEGSTVPPSDAPSGYVTEIEFPTYGFSDPDPVPRTESQKP